MRTFGMCVSLVIALGLTTAPAMAQEGPPLPKPGPEHDIFKEIEGTWAARLESWATPEAEPTVSTGVETTRVGCGGLCLITDFEGSFMDMPFEGHGTDTYDPAKKKYVGSWTDSMSSGISMSESTYDAATKTMTGWIEGPDMTGEVSKMKTTSVIKDPKTRVFSMYNVGSDGKETLGMRITYTKQK